MGIYIANIYNHNFRNTLYSHSHISSSVYQINFVSFDILCPDQNQHHQNQTLLQTQIRSCEPRFFLLTNLFLILKAAFFESNLTSTIGISRPWCLPWSMNRIFPVTSRSILLSTSHTRLLIQVFLSSAPAGIGVELVN